MKTLFSIVLFAFIFSVVGKSQNTYNLPLDPNTNKVLYKEVVDEPAPKDTLFTRAFMWVKATFPNFSSAISKKDPENGILECNMRVKLTTTDKKGIIVSGGAISYTLRIEMKENKYRIIATDFKRVDVSLPIESWFKDENAEAIALHQQHFTQVENEVKKSFESVKQGLKAKVIIKDEW